MKILLISPNYVLGKLNKRNLYGGMLPPLGLLSIASPLINKGHEVVLLENEIGNESLLDFKSELLKENPDVIGFSVNSFLYIYTVNFIAEAKRVLPDIPIIVGGPHATAVPEEFLSSQDVDFVVRAEGEETCLDLINCLDSRGDIGKILGLSYQKKGVIIHNPARPLALSLDSFPFPAYHLLPRSNLKHYGLHRETKLTPVLTCMTSRGCPIACSFCSVKLATGRAAFWRGHSPEYTIELFEYLIKEFKIRELSLQDDCYTADNERIEIICDEMVKRKINKKIIWRAGNGTRADTVTEDLLRKMKKAGCYHIGYGIESGNQRILTQNGKEETLEQIRDAIVWTNKVGLRSNGSFILGLKGDTEATMQETIDFAKSLPLDQASFNMMTPIIGSAFQKRVEKHGRFLVDRNSPEYWTGEKGPVFELDECTAELLMRMYRSAYRQYYYRPSYVMRQFLSIRSFEDIKYLGGGFWDVVSASLYKSKKQEVDAAIDMITKNSGSEEADTTHSANSLPMTEDLSYSGQNNNPALKGEKVIPIKDAA